MTESAMTDLREEARAEHLCPLCSRGPNLYCKSENGQNSVIVHDERLALALRVKLDRHAKWGFARGYNDGIKVAREVLAEIQEAR